MSSVKEPERESKVVDRADHAVLLVQGGANNGMTIPLLGRTVTLGRQPDNDVVLDEAAVSRRHAVIIETKSGYSIKDLNSTNGTYVNRKRIGPEEHPLRHGDRIRLGGSNVTFIFRHSGATTLKLSVVEPPSEAVVVDAKARQVYIRGEKLEPPLSRKEFDLLQLLYSRRGEAVSREDIARYVWPERPDGDVGNHEIEQCVHRVRTRIEEDPSSPKYLVTIRGFGYKLL